MKGFLPLPWIAFSPMTANASGRVCIECLSERGTIGMDWQGKNVSSKAADRIPVVISYLLDGSASEFVKIRSRLLLFLARFISRNRNFTLFILHALPNCFAQNFYALLNIFIRAVGIVNPHRPHISL